MKKLGNHFAFLMILLMGLFGNDQPAHAAKAFVTDTFEITLRTGPSTEHKVIAMLPSGTGVEVLDKQEGWSRVRVSESGRDNKEGWLLSRFLINRWPWEVQAKALEKENLQLKEKLAKYEGDSSNAVTRELQLKEKLEATTEELKKLQQEYAELKSGATDYLSLKDQYEATGTALKSAQETVEQLTQENQRMKFSHQIKWFLVGAAVLFGGWLIGLTMGRQQKRRRPMF